MHPVLQQLPTSALGDLEAALVMQGAASVSLCEHPCQL